MEPESLRIKRAVLTSYVNSSCSKGINLEKMDSDSQIHSSLN